MLALELGGNNPLIAWDGDPEAVARVIAMSAFITTGQRCSCARRLIVPEGATGDAFIEALAALIDRLPVAAWSDAGDAFMGPLVSVQAAERALDMVGAIERMGARPLRRFTGIAGRPGSFVKPALYDVTGVDVPDEEIFAPVLFVRRVGDFEQAIAAANATAYGLSAGLITGDDAKWEHYLDFARRRDQPQPPDHRRGGEHAVRRAGRIRQPSPGRVVRGGLLRLSGRQLRKRCRRARGCARDRLTRRLRHRSHQRPRQLSKGVA
jgi:acyl-CoA reductase-like NAD-dependent aldehyde dehydrogenase